MGQWPFWSETWWEHSLARFPPNFIPTPVMPSPPLQQHPPAVISAQTSPLPASLDPVLRPALVFNSICSLCSQSPTSAQSWPPPPALCALAALTSFCSSLQSSLLPLSQPHCTRWEDELHNIKVKNWISPVPHSWYMDTLEATSPSCSFRKPRCW